MISLTKKFFDVKKKPKNFSKGKFPKKERGQSEVAEPLKHSIREQSLKEDLFLKKLFCIT